MGEVAGRKIHWFLEYNSSTSAPSFALQNWIGGCGYTFPDEKNRGR